MGKSENKLGLLVLLLLLGINSSAALVPINSQQSADSLQAVLSNLEGEELLNAYTRLSYYYREFNHEISNDYSDYLLHYLKSSKCNHLDEDKKCSFAAPMYFNKGYCHKSRSEYLSAIEDFLQAAKNYPDDFSLASTFEQIGSCYNSLGQYEDALTYYHEALDYLGSNRRNFLYSRLINNIAVVLQLSGNYEQALKYFSESLELKEAASDIKGAALTYMNIASVLLEQNKNEEAEEKYLIALEKAQEASDTLTISRIYNNLGNLYADIGERDTAVIYYRRALLLEKSLADEWGMVNSLNNLVTVAVNREGNKNHIQIKAAADSALVSALKLNSLSLISKAYENLALLEEKAGNIKNAYEMKKNFYATKDSILDMQTEEKLLEMEALLNHKNKIAQVSLLETQNMENSILLKKSKTNIIVLGILVVTCLVTGIFLFRNYILRKKYQLSMEDLNQDIEKANEQLRIKINDLENFRNSLTEKFEQAITEVRNRDNILIIQSRYVALSDMIENISMKWKKNLVCIQEQLTRLKTDFEYNRIDGNILEEIVSNSMKILYEMSDKIDDFRDFFRPHQSPSLFYVEDIINKSIDFVAEYFQKYNINIVFKDNEPDLKIEGYPNELSQVILNIIHNSLDAFQVNDTPNPEIRIKLRSEFGRVILEITDNAGGVPVELLENVFDAFVTSKKDADSCGLGLYIAREIVQTRFLGAISIRNEAGGALVKIIF
ncbi:MAG: tetratricopeptide repeat-containing sensor histidine kinase [Candidatus Cloacimonetes bacterium]|nr:tetratricopeptide repeat-containing sensor histidine kinase [Candidatus Cloacimonadota bacterium]